MTSYPLPADMSSEPLLYSIPLNVSFPVDGPVPSNNYYEISAPRQWRAQGAFFQDADETMLYSFAGFLDDRQAPTNDLDSYNITSGQWSNISVSGGDFNFYTREATSRAVSKGTSGALGFVSGGWNNVGGMIRFDASDPANPQWRNETDNSPPLTLEGSMEFIRLGPKGSLISFGGYDKDNINPNLTGWLYDLRPMSAISVYDIDSATWYNVTASGDIPQNRSAFCTAVSSAPDDSSFQITMYGGWDLFGGYSLADTYVLSIPSFQWINVSARSPNLDATLSSNPSDRSGRDHPQCAVYKDRRMLVLGGILRIDNNEQNLRGCDDDLPALRALDLSTFQWTKNWDPSPPPYTVPEEVFRLIGGNGQGGATVMQPDGGFNDSALTGIFAQVAPRYSPPVAASTGPGLVPDSPPENNSDNNRGGSSTAPSAATIAGSVIGGIAILALIATGIFFLLRRRRKRRQSQQSPPVAWDGSPQEMSSNEHQSAQVVRRGEYHHLKSSMELPGAEPGDYEPVRQEMDGGFRGSEMGGGLEPGGVKSSRRLVGELPA